MSVDVVSVLKYSDLLREYECSDSLMDLGHLDLIHMLAVYVSLLLILNSVVL